MLQQLNALNKGEEEDETISVAEMKSLQGYDDSLKEVADYQFYIAYDFYAKNNSHFHRSPYYGYYQGEPRFKLNYFLMSQFFLRKFSAKFCTLCFSLQFETLRVEL